jgi:hypothetical protein
MVLWMLFACGSLGLTAIELAPAEGRLSISPQETLDFGEAIANDETNTETVTLAANGNESVRVAAIWVESSSGAFTLSGSPPIPKRLQPGQQLGIKLRFKPGSKGSFTGTFVAETEGGVIVERDLKGEGCSDRDDNGRCD